MNDVELYDIGQTSADLDIDLFAGDLSLDVSDVQDQPGFEYPAMLISGIRFNDTLRVLKATRQESYRLFDVWLDLGDGSPPIKQGTLPVTSDTFLAMRYLGLNVTLYLREGEVQTLNLKDLKVIEDFI